MRGYFLAVVLALGLAGCVDMGFTPNNADVNGDIVYSDAGGGE